MAGFWPNAGTPGANIRSMYERIAKSASEPSVQPKQEPAIKAEVPHVNGLTNGVAVKRE